MMHFKRLWAVALSALVSSAAGLSISIASSSVLADPSSLPPSTHAVLLGPPGVRYDVPLRRDNTFKFPELGAASYLLSIHSRDYLFPPLRVDVSRATADDVTAKIEVWQTFRGNEWSNKGPHLGAGGDDLQVVVGPTMQKDFYQARGGFNILSFLKSPMILMALFSVGLIFGMPYMLDSMDEETRAEFDEMQKKTPITGQNGAASQISNFDLAGWMAGKNSASNSGGESTK